MIRLKLLFLPLLMLVLGVTVNAQSTNLLIVPTPRISAPTLVIEETANHRAIHAGENLRNQSTLFSRCFGNTEQT